MVSLEFGLAHLAPSMTPTSVDPIAADALATRISRRLQRAHALLLVLAGAALLVGGVWLMTLAGSLYYALAGLVVVVSGVLAWRGDRRAAWLYAVLLAGTMVWAVLEAGFDVFGHQHHAFLVGLVRAHVHHRRRHDLAHRRLLGRP